jgi:hypothetical protein
MPQDGTKRDWRDRNILAMLDQETLEVEAREGALGAREAAVTQREQALDALAGLMSRRREKEPFNKRLRRTIAAWWKHAQGSRGHSRYGLPVFVEAMAPYDVKGVKGVSREHIENHFINGDKMPTVEWLRAAAEVLGVRVEWLAFGSGAPTFDAEMRAHLQSSETRSFAYAVQQALAAYSQLRRTLDTLADATDDAVWALAEMGGVEDPTALIQSATPPQGESEDRA